MLASKVSSSKVSSKAKFNLQFACHSPTLPTKLAEDIRRSGFTSRPKYLNALLEKVLSFKTGDRMPSCIETLFELIELFESLPIERIRQLAPTQNRSFAQMMKHLLEIALSYYPEDSQLSDSESARDTHLAESFLHRRDLQRHDLQRHRAQL